MEQLKLSIKKKDYEGSHNKFFKSISVEREKLEYFLKKYNYSPITWKINKKKENEEYNRGRKKETFESAAGLVIDIDENLSIAKAEEKLKENNYNYVIITSRNHQKDTDKEGRFSPAQDRYHILLFFNKEVINPDIYEAAYSCFSDLFPELDPKCKSLDRYLFGSPSKAEYYSWFEGEDIDVDKLIEESTNFLNQPVAEEKKLWEFDNDIKVVLENKSIVDVVDIKEAKKCHCPRPDHPDRNPSALISFNEEADKWVVNCFGCGYIGWSKWTKTEYELNQANAGFLLSWKRYI